MWMWRMDGCWEKRGSALVRIPQMLKGLGWTVFSWRAALAAERAAARAPAAREERRAGMAMAGGQPPAKRKMPLVVSRLLPS